MAAEANILNKEEAEKLERIAFILKVVAHPLRLAIVHILEQHPELSVSDICTMLNSEQSLTSHHLQNMKLKGILSSRRDGRIRTSLSCWPACPCIRVAGRAVRDRAPCLPTEARL